MGVGAIGALVGLIGAGVGAIGALERVGAGVGAIGALVGLIGGGAVGRSDETPEGVLFGAIDE